MERGKAAGRLAAVAVALMAAVLVPAGAAAGQTPYPPPPPPVAGGGAAPAQATRPVAPLPQQASAPQPAKRFSAYPTLPAGSGTGRRIVYANGAQRVWLVESDGTVVASHPVSGRPGQPPPGTYAVYSKSLNTYSTFHPWVTMRYMVRFAKTPRGNNIGFHEIPRSRGAPMQTDAQLGQPLSGGCVRQATAAAILVWNWAPIGTKVVVLP